MSEFTLKYRTQAQDPPLSLKYQKNIPSPKSFIKTSQNSKLLGASMNYQNQSNTLNLGGDQSNTHNSFIPSSQNNEPKEKDFLNIWKDFRNDIRKKCTISGVGAPLSTRNANKDISSDKIGKFNNSNNSLLTNQGRDFKRQVNFGEKISEQKEQGKFQRQNEENTDTKITYDLQRANKIQDMFQKYLKDDGQKQKQPQNTGGLSYLKQSSPQRNSMHLQPKQTSQILSKSPLHRRDHSGFTKTQVIQLDKADRLSNDRFKDSIRQEIKRESITSADDLKQTKISLLSAPFTPKRENVTIHGFYESVNNFKTNPSPLNKNIMNALETRSSQLSSNKKQTQFEFGNKSGFQSLNKSPRAAQTINKFTKQYKKDDIAALRQQISQLSQDEAEGLPFSLQNELLRLAQAINDKFEKSSHQQILKQLK